MHKIRKSYMQTYIELIEKERERESTESKKETAALRASGVEDQSRAAAMARATLWAMLVALSSMATGFYVSSYVALQGFLGLQGRRGLRLQTHWRERERERLLFLDGVLITCKRQPESDSPVSFLSSF